MISQITAATPPSNTAPIRKAAPNAIKIYRTRSCQVKGISSRVFFPVKLPSVLPSSLPLSLLSPFDTLCHAAECLPNSPMPARSLISATVRPSSSNSSRRPMSAPPHSAHCNTSCAPLLIHRHTDGTQRNVRVRSPSAAAPLPYTWPCSWHSGCGTYSRKADWPGTECCPPARSGSSSHRDPESGSPRTVPSYRDAADS